ncbi:type I-F CRISPR-associated protein Csy1 [Pigmentibacter sp. JX0631]|uniref:type I-F CRISPR-associated protein Csy1 n=1 Tax=Pigmentibacter sp. JX0631 TaxID=2976982 RepID=UPI0024695343|nr:type I-F CRISPR-associated protein Csy1 [Pigmentibacter sp. JX0631]WGL59725.1 type I-F CRISPR-associated protein Csy1 [Pigmentibacter sp. JX0631]
MENQDFVIKIKEYIDSKLKDKNDPENENVSLKSGIYADWIDKAAKNANSICITSHPAKYSNSEIKTGNIKAELVDVLLKDNNLNNDSTFFVSTHNLENKNLDIYCNAAYLGYAGFLLLKNPKNDQHLINEIVAGNIHFLSAFSENKKQICEWVELLKESIKDKNYASHYLSKQIYFPVANKEYHIVSPLMASSLYHKVLEKITFFRYSENAKLLREKKKNCEYSDETIKDFPNLIEVKYGGTKPQNISYLNSIRNGKVFLLCNKPPVWNKNKSIKIVTINNIWKDFESIVYRKIKNFKFFLHNEKANNFENRDLRANYLSEIVESLVFYLVSLKKDIKKYKLDDSIINSYFDVYFKQNKLKYSEFDNENFIEKIANEFTFLLIKAIKSDSLNFSDDEYQHINKLVKNEMKWLLDAGEL